MDKTQSSWGPGSIDQQMQISLYNAAESSYSSLQLKEIIHPYWIVSHVLEGEVETVTDGKSIIAKKGDVMVHPPHIPFSEIAKGPGVHQWMGFHAAVIHNLDLFQLFHITLVVKLSSPDVYTMLFKDFLKSWQDQASLIRDFVSSAYATTLLSLILGSCRILPHSEHTALVPSHQDRFHLIIRYIMDNFGNKISRGELAAKLHIHPVYMDRIFMDGYGMTPMQMLREMRLKRAKQMLESNNDTLTSIALSCGFNDAAYLSKMFLKQFGQTPGQYRERIKQTKLNYLN